MNEPEREMFNARLQCSMVQLFDQINVQMLFQGKIVDLEQNHLLTQSSVAWRKQLTQMFCKSER